MKEVTMNTMLHNSNSNTAPKSGFASAAGGVHRGIWIGGGLMALTIVALATALVVKNTDSVTDNATPLAATMPATTTTNATTPDVATAQAPVVVAPQAPAVQAPAQAHVYTQAPVRTVHHAPARTYSNANGAYGPRNGDANPGYDNAQQVAAAPVCATCGVVDSYSAVQVQGQANGVGAVAGGLGGALIGSQIAGRSNHTLGGVIGAIGGGLLGNTIEKHERTVTVYDVHVRMNDGSTRTIRQSTVPNVGSEVRVEGNTLHTVHAPA